MEEDRKPSVEERLENLEKIKSRDQQLRERAEKLEKIKRTPIKFVADDPSRIHKSKAQIVAEKQAKRDEELEVKKFLADRKKQKEAGDAMQGKEEVKEEKVIEKPKAKKGRPKKIEE